VGKPEWKMVIGKIREGWCGIDCIDVTQDRDQWRTLVNSVMNLTIP
jgi:hypothetical protein